MLCSSHWIYCKWFSIFQCRIRRQRTQLNFIFVCVCQLRFQKKSSSIIAHCNFDEAIHIFIEYMGDRLSFCLTRNTWRSFVINCVAFASVWFILIVSSIWNGSNTFWMVCQLQCAFLPTMKNKNKNTSKYFVFIILRIAIELRVFFCIQKCYS